MPRAATGSIRRLPSKRWQVRYTGPDGVRHKAPVTFDTKRDASAWLVQTRADIARGEWSGDRPAEASVTVTFDEYAARWLRTRKVRGRALAPRTLEGYQDLLVRFILPTFGSKPLHTVTRTDVDRWYDRLPDDRPTYRARAYSLLRAILATATDDDVFAKNPARIRGAGQAERRHEPRPASLDELDALTTAMPPRYRLLVQLAAWCALRFGELTELRREDVELTRVDVAAPDGDGTVSVATGVLHVRRAVVLVNGEFVVKTPKSAAGIRDVAIPPHLIPMVREHLLQHTAPGADGLLFPSRTDPSQHLRQSSLARVYYPARDEAGRPDLRFHDLRHTGLTMAAQTGATLAELMGRAGHSTSSAALRYQHAAQGRDAVIASALSALAERRA